MSARRTRLRSGATVVSETMAAMESVSFGLHFAIGSRDETVETNGISHFLEHLLFKGTRRRSADEINRAIDRLGGGSNAYTSKETLCLHARVLAQDLEEHFELYADMATGALPPGVDEEVEREREVILTEIASVEDSPEEAAGDLCDLAFFGEHPLGLPVTGTALAVQGLPLDLLRAHLRAHIGSSDLVVAAAGKIEHERLVALVEAELAGLPPGRLRGGTRPPDPRAEVRVVERDLEQVQICLSAPGVARADPRRPAAELLSAILGEGYSSRLFREVRDRRGLAYSISSALATYLDGGSFNVSLGVSPERLEEALEVVGVTLSDMRDGGPVPEELSAAKRHLSTGMRLSLESSGARAAFLAEQTLCGSDELDCELALAKLERVELGELRALARELLSGPIALAAVGPLSRERLGAGPWRLPA
jgi:predicted Zn-dependent peptidase